MIVAVTNTGSALPTIISFNPPTLTGSGQINTNVTITGTNFVPDATTATVGGTSSTVTFVSTTQITVAFPPLGAGVATVVVTTPAGSASASYTYTVPPPTIDFVSPSSGTTGTTISVYGTNFSGSTVTIGGQSVSATGNSGVRQFTCPSFGSDGDRTITITNAGGSASASFTYYTYRGTETTFFLSGSGSYTVPAWASSVDVVCLGGGASGDGGSLTNRRGGAAGSWGGSSFSGVAGSSLSYSVGVGGFGGSRFDRNIAGTASTANGVTGAGGSGSNGSTSPVIATGAAPSAYSFNGTNFTPSLNNGYGGDAASVSVNAGSPGGNGQVWFIARQ